MACACAGLLAACGEPRTYETSDLTFQYPSDWRRVEDVEFPNAEASGATTPEHTVGLDRENWVSVSADPLDAPLSDTERHAEEQILRWMEANNLKPITVGAGRPICPNCADVIARSGATAASRLK